MSILDIVEKVVARLIKVEKRLAKLELREHGQSEKSTILTIDGGLLAKSRRYHIVAAESGSTDDLDAIDTGPDGQILILRAYTGHTITVKDGTGNLSLAGDFTLSGNSTITLIYDSTYALWLEISRSTN